MSKAVTSIGVEFYVGYSANKTSRPTLEQYRKLPQIVECSDLDETPEAIGIKSYDGLGHINYVPDYIDTGGTHSLTANLTVDREGEKIWNSMVDQYNEGKYIWLCVNIPQIDESTYIPICPIKTGVYSLKQQEIITQKLYYTIVGEIEFGETMKTRWGKKWNYLNSFNGGQQLVSNNEIDIEDINKLFNNLFYLKGN